MNKETELEMVKELSNERGYDEDRLISAFAFNTGRLIEHIVKTTSNNAIEELAQLKTKILVFRNIMFNNRSNTALMDMFDKEFGIKNVDKGEINVI